MHAAFQAETEALTHERHRPWPVGPEGVVLERIAAFYRPSVTSAAGGDDVVVIWSSTKAQHSGSVRRSLARFSSPTPRQINDAQFGQFRREKRCSRLPDSAEAVDQGTVDSGRFVDCVTAAMLDETKPSRPTRERDQ